MFFLFMTDSRIDSLPSEIIHVDETKSADIPHIKKEEAIAIYSRSLAVSTSNGLVSPFVSFIAIKMGASAGIVAWIQAISNLLRQFLDPIFGRLSDMMKRRIPFIVISTITWIIPYAFLYFVQAPAFIILIAAIVNILSSFGNPAWISLQNELFPAEVRGKLTGRVTWFGSFGSMLATLTTGVILTYIFGPNINYQKYIYIPVLIGVCISIIAVLPFRKVKEPLLREGVEAAKISKSLKEGFKEIIKNKPFMKFTILYAIAGIFWTFSWPLFSLKQVNVLNAEAMEIAILEVIFAVTSLIFVLIGSRVTDKYGRTKMIFLNRFGLFLFPLAYIFATQIWHLYIIHLIIASLFSFSFAGVNAYILDITPKRDSGLYIGFLSMVTGVCYFIGTLFGGYFVDVAEMLFNKTGVSFILTSNISTVFSNNLFTHTLVGQNVMLDTFGLALTIALAFVAVMRFLLSFMFLSLKEVKEFTPIRNKNKSTK